MLGDVKTLRCAYPSEDGVGEISVDLLREFEVGATAQFFTSVHTDVAVGNARVWFGARRELLVPERTGYVTGVLQ